MRRARSREDRPAYACGYEGSLNCKFKSEEVKKRERIGRQGVGRDLGRGEKKKKEKGGSEEAGRKPEILHTRARPTRHPSISFDAHFAYAQHAFSPRHLPPPLLSSVLLSSLPRTSRNSLSLSLFLHVTYHYGYDIRHTRQTTTSGYIPSKRALVSSLETLFPSLRRAAAER